MSGTAWQRWLALAALMAALTAFGFTAIDPAYNSGETVVEKNGTWVYAVLLFPVAIAAVPAFLRAGRHGTTVAAAWLLAAFCLIAGASVGIFFWPTAILMVAAAFAGTKAHREPASSAS